MYNNKEVQREILSLLRQMNEKLDHLGSNTASGQKESEESDSVQQAAPSFSVSKEKQEQPRQSAMWNLTQSQYEISNELFDGIKKLKQVILEGEKHSTQAKKQYQK